MIKKSLFALALAGVSIASAHADTTIDTVTPWDKSNAVSSWGSSGTATYGQTFTTGATDTVLKSFSFYINPIDVDYKAYVGVWDGSKVSSLVWSSPVLNADTGLNTFDLFKITPGNLQLQANTQYVAFFSVSGLANSQYLSTIWGYTGTDAYSGGGFVFSNNGDDFAALTTNTWDGSAGGWWSGAGVRDLAFKAELTAAVPEPETYAMFLAGLGIMGVMARRRKQA